MASPGNVLRAALIAHAALGATACAGVLELDTYRDAPADGGGPLDAGGGPAEAAAADAAGVVDSGPDAEESAGDARSNDGSMVLTSPPICVPGMPIAGQVFGFEDGVEGWHAFHGGGTVAQSASCATSCAESLQVTTHLDDWYGAVAPATPLPLPTAGLHDVLVDVTTTTAGTMQAIALQFGSDYHWCQSAFTHADAGTTSTVSVDIATLLASTTACGSAPMDTTTIRAIWVFLSAGGVFYVDNVRTE